MFAARLCLAEALDRRGLLHSANITMSAVRREVHAGGHVRLAPSRHALFLRPHRHVARPKLPSSTGNRLNRASEADRICEALV